MANGIRRAEFGCDDTTPKELLLKRLRWPATLRV
jgi:hypothetical protein